MPRQYPGVKVKKGMRSMEEAAVQLHTMFKIIQESRKKKDAMSKAEKMLIVGTFGICTGVWVTLAYLVYLNINSL